MARKIKFPLEMKDGIMVRSIEELRECFDLEKAVIYFFNGKLMTWIKDRNYDKEAEELGRVPLDAKDIEKDICKIFDVEYVEKDIDIEKLKSQDAKISKIKEYTDDEEIINNVNCIVFNNDELVEVLHKNVSTIYLVENEFVIPLDINNRKFVGFGNSTAIINSRDVIDFKKKEIVFENINFNEGYCKVIKAKKIEDNNSSKKKKQEYKTSSLLDFMLNDEERKISRRYFNIVQEGLSDIEFDINKPTKTFLDILEDADLCNKFYINKYGKSLNRILKNVELNEKFLNYKKRIL